MLMHYHNITEQLLRSVDLLLVLTLFECPRVYADVEMVRGTGKGLHVLPIIMCMCVCVLFPMCVCVCVCVCERERERDRETEREREREREREEERCEGVTKYILILVNVLYVVVSWKMVYKELL